MKKISFFLTALIFLGSCREDTLEFQSYGRLIGEVLDADSLVPITGVSITTNPETELVATDELGEFLIDSLLEGSYSIRGRLAGYEDAIISVQLQGDRTNSVTLLMSKDLSLNNPPSIPLVVQPADGAQGVDPNLTLAWTSSDANGDSLTYDVYLFPSDTSAGIPLALELADTFLNVEGMKFNQKYYWQVIAKDGVNPPTYGEVWSFGIREFPRDEYRYAFVRSVNGTLTIFGGTESLGATGEELSFQLTNGAKSYWRPRLRPILRDKMAALSVVGSDVHIFVLERDGANPRQVTPQHMPLRSKDASLASYCWSPTGDQLMYMNFGQLYRVNIDGSGLDLVAEADDGYLFTGVDWTARNNTIIATAERPGTFQSKLYKFRIGIDSVPEAILETELNGQIRHPVFAPDGKRIAFTYNDSGDFTANGLPNNTVIRVYNIETMSGHNVQLGKRAGTNDLQPKFTNGGAKILFVSKPVDNIGPSEVWIMDMTPTSQNNRTLLFNNADMPDWN